MRKKSILLVVAALLVSAVPCVAAPGDTIQAEAHDTLFNGLPFPSSVNNLWSGGWFRIKAVDFGSEGMTWVTMRAMSKYPRAVSTAIFHIDGLDTTAGTTIIDTVLVMGYDYKEHISQLKAPVTGVHDLYIYSGPNSGMEIDWIKFHPTYPKKIDAKSIIEFEKYDIAREPPAGGLVQGQVTINNFWRSNWVGFRNVDFGDEPITKITIGGLYKNWSAVYTLYVILDSPDLTEGKIVGRLNMGTFYNNYTYNLLDNIRGTHDLYFLAAVEGGDGYELDYFTFGPDKKDIATGISKKSAESAHSTFSVHAQKGGIQFSLPEDAKTLSVYRADGALISRSVVYGRQGLLNLQLPRGTYVVEVLGAQKSARQKLIVSR